jgi:hydroxyethylthiazole kinase-like uncharacterized protein yjeF
MPSDPELVTPALLRGWSLPEPGRSKHSRGHAVVVGGSRSTPGAVLLAGLAALRVGAGVLAMAVPESVSIPLALAVPEAGVSALPEAADGTLDKDAAGPAVQDRMAEADAVLIGPGLDDPEQTRELLLAIVPHIRPAVPVVLDAFALGVLPDVPSVAEALAGRLTLTPNEKEAAFLLELDEDDVPEPIDAARRIAAKWAATVSYHGVIAAEDGRLRAVDTGHSGLGTSGSGDVLAGATIGLLARGADAAQAASWGAYLHAAAGDRLAARVGRLGFLARELLDELPLVLTELQS